jgi:methylmalonyl-CoA/ethylmalonyl-CoA epimerase
VQANWLAERGEGFHHVGYIVDWLEQTTAEMEATGHSAIARIHSFGAAGAAYYDTADALGFLIEAVEPPAQMPPTDFTL